MKKLQNGRSMVEMIGVLAIIGVLSIGAIAGYSKAMIKYKLNKQTAQIDLIFNVVYSHLDDIRKNKWGFDWIPVFIKMGEFPEDMYSTKESSTLNDIFKSNYSLTYHDTGYIGIFSQLNKGQYSQIACENIYTVAKDWHDSLRSVQILIGNGSYIDNASYFGNKYCSNTNKCLKDLTVSKISGICNVCEDDKLCRLLIRFQ